MEGHCLGMGSCLTRSSHVGNAGVGVVSLKGAPLSMPLLLLGVAIRCLLPLGSGRFMHLVVFYGYQGADSSAEQLQLTDHLLDAALSELAVVARVSPVCWLGIQRGAHEDTFSGQRYLRWALGLSGG